MKKDFISKVAFLGVLLSASCSTEVIDSGTDGPDNPPTVSQLKVRVMTNDYANTRDNSNSGISSLVIAFYNGNEFVSAEEAKSNDNGIYTVSLQKSDNGIPNSILAYANISKDDIPKCKISELGNLTSEETTKTTITTLYDSSETPNFVMSTPLRIKSDGTKQLAVPITPENLQGNDVVAISLEKVASKVTLQTSESASLDVQMKSPAESRPDRVLNLTIDSWGVTAVEKSSYIIKQLEVSEAHPLPNWEGWNNYKYINWAHSVAYGETGEGKYPTGTEAGSFSLSYLKIGGASTELGAACYCHETTRPNSVYAIANSRASVVICGHYNIVKENVVEENIEEGATNNLAESLYVSGSTVYTNSEYENLNDDAKKKCVSYPNGQCYFIVPIENISHINAGENHVHDTGCYGLVRNHHYRLTINNITGLGIPYSSTDDYALEREAPSGLDGPYTVNISAEVLEWVEVGQNIEITKPKS